MAVVCHALKFFLKQRRKIENSSSCSVSFGQKAVNNAEPKRNDALDDKKTTQLCK